MAIELIATPVEIALQQPYSTVAIVSKQVYHLVLPNSEALQSPKPYFSRTVCERTCKALCPHDLRVALEPVTAVVTVTVDVPLADDCCRRMKGEVCSLPGIMDGRSRMTIDLRIPTMGGVQCV